MYDSKPIVVFIHGLNTFGDDLLHLGPVALGRMDLHLRCELESLGCRVVSVDQVGFGSPEDQAETVLTQLARREDFEPDQTIHLFGQSLGGLVARVVAHRLKNESSKNPRKLSVGKIITAGTPHRGTIAANFAENFANENRRLSQLLRAFGYNLGEKSETFRHMTPQSMDNFNLKYPMDNAAPEHSFVCAVPLASVSRQFLGLYGRLHGVGRLEMIRSLIADQNSFSPSDGLVPVGSQNWGQSQGPYALDHFAQMGYFSALHSKAHRAFTKLEFQRFCRDIARLTSDESVPPSIR